MTLAENKVVWIGLALVAAFVAFLVLYLTVYRAGDATVVAPGGNASWQAFRDSTPSPGQRNCTGEKVSDGSRFDGMYMFTCRLVPNHVYYTEHRDVAPADWVSTAPFIVQNASEPESEPDAEVSD